MPMPPPLSETMSLVELLASAPFRLPPRALSPLRETPSCLSTCLPGIVRANSAQGLQTSVGSVDARNPNPAEIIKVEPDTTCMEYPPDMSCFAESEEVAPSGAFFTSEDYQKYSTVTYLGTGMKRSRDDWTWSSSDGVSLTDPVVKASVVTTQPASKTPRSSNVNSETSEESTLPSTPPSHPPAHVGVTVGMQVSSQSTSQCTSQNSSEADGTLDPPPDTRGVRTSMEDLRQAAKAFAQNAQAGAGAVNGSSQGSNWNIKPDNGGKLVPSRLVQEPLVEARSAAPRWSKLLPAEHAYYVEACKPGAANREMQKGEAQYLATLTAKVRAEQEQYLLETESIAESDAQRYLYCHADVAAQVDALMAERRDRVRRAPQLWHRYRSISLNKLWEAPGEARLQPIRRVERYGVCPEFVSPASSLHLNRRTSYLARGKENEACGARAPGGGDTPVAGSKNNAGPAFIGPSPRPPSSAEHEDPLTSVEADNHKASVNGRSPGARAGVTDGAGGGGAKNRSDRPCVSEDCNARRLAGAEGARVVLSSSSLSALIATLPPTYREGWELPVRVEASASESRSEGTVVYIDKPLVKRRMTLREKNTLFYKHALHHVGTHSGRGNVLDLGKKPAHARTPVDESLPSASSQPAEPPQELRDQPVAPGLSESDESDGEMCIDDDGEDNTLTQGTVSHPNCEVNLASDERSGPCLDREGTKVAAERSRAAAKLGGHSYAAGARAGETRTGRADGKDQGGNLTYVLWQLGSFKLLLRCEYRAHVRDAASSSGYKFMVTRAKMEYRPHQGWEGITAEESARWWAASVLRPDAMLVIGRIAPTTSTLLRLSHRSTAQIQQDIDFDSGRASNALLLILQHLELLPPGKYLLVHPPNSPHVICYREFADKACGSPRNAEETYPELPCEDGVPLDMHCPSKQCPVDWRLPPCELCASTPFDLHKAHSHSGQSDEETIPMIPWWKPADASVPQIPNTFPPNPLQTGRKKKQKYLKDKTLQNSKVDHGTTTRQSIEEGATSLSAPSGTAKPSYRPRFPNIRYCYGFAEQGVCRSQDNCSFPHWTYDVVQEMARELNMKPMSQKKSRGVCFMFARTGSCNAGFACSYAHTPNAAVQRNLSAKTKFPKVKGSPVLPRDEYSEQLAKHMLMIQNKRVR